MDIIFLDFIRLFRTATLWENRKQHPRLRKGFTEINNPNVVPNQEGAKNHSHNCKIDFSVQEFSFTQKKYRESFPCLTARQLFGTKCSQMV